MVEWLTHVGEVLGLNTAPSKSFSINFVHSIFSRYVWMERISRLLHGLMGKREEKKKKKAKQWGSFRHKPTARWLYLFWMKNDSYWISKIYFGSCNTQQAIIRDQWRHLEQVFGIFKLKIFLVMVYPPFSGLHSRAVSDPVTVGRTQWTISGSDGRCVCQHRRRLRQHLAQVGHQLVLLPPNHIWRLAGGVSIHLPRLV